VISIRFFLVDFSFEGTDIFAGGWYSPAAFPPQALFGTDAFRAKAGRGTPSPRSRRDKRSAWFWCQFDEHHLVRNLFETNKKFGTTF